MDTSPNTRPNVVDETTNSHVNINDKEIELLIIASIETLKRQTKKCGKDEIFALVKDSLEQAITTESFEKSLALLQASNSINVILFLTAHICPILNIDQFLKFVLKRF